MQPPPSRESSTHADCGVCCQTETRLSEIKALPPGGIPIHSLGKVLKIKQGQRKKKELDRGHSQSEHPTGAFSSRESARQGQAGIEAGRFAQSWQAGPQQLVG